MPFHRELVIKFGARGYVVRYRCERGADVVVLRVPHQREDLISGGVGGVPAEIAAVFLDAY